MEVTGINKGDQMHQLAIAISLLYCLAAGAQIIYPDGDYGKFLIKLPKLTNIEQNKVAKVIEYSFISEVSHKKIKIIPEKEFNIPKGKGCFHLKAAVNGFNTYESKLCDIQILANKTSVLNLSAATFHWDIEKIQVDFGKRLMASIDLETDFDYKYLQDSEMNQTLILPPNNYSIQYKNIGVFSSEDRNFLLEAGKHHFISLDPKEDKRKIVTIDAPEGYFNTPDIKDKIVFNYKILTNRYYKNISNKNIHHPVNIHHNQNTSLTSGSFGYWKKVHSSNQIQSFKVYPLTTEEKEYERLEFIVNNIVQIVDFEKDDNPHFKVFKANIGLIRGELDGFFTLYKLNEENKVEFKFYPAVTTTDYAGRLIPGLYTSNSFYYETERSIDLPNGYEYRLEAYLKTDDDYFELQSTQIIKP